MMQQERIESSKAAVRAKEDLLVEASGNAEALLEAQRTFADDVALAGSVSGAVLTRTAAEGARQGARSREMYDFIVSVTGDGVDEEADDWIQHYYVSKVQGLTTAFVVALVAGIVGVLLGNTAGGATLPMLLSWLACFVVLAGIIVFAMVNMTKKRIGGKITTTLDSGRDPVTFCARYLAYLREREPKDFSSAIWLYSKGLRWQGRWNDAQKLFESYLETYSMTSDARTQCFHHQLLAGVAFDKERYPALASEIAYLESIPQEELPEGFDKDLELLKKLAEVLKLEREGKKQEAYDLVESFFYHSENVLRMALALHMGANSSNRTDALEWINFVVKMGMSTWCVKRAKDIRASGKLQKLPKGESRFGMNVRERHKEARKKRKEARRHSKLADAADTLPQVPE